SPEERARRYFAKLEAPVERVRGHALVERVRPDRAARHLRAHEVARAAPVRGTAEAAHAERASAVDACDVGRDQRAAVAGEHHAGARRGRLELGAADTSTQVDD